MVPLTTKLTLPLPHCPHTSRLAQSGTVVSAPWRLAISAGSGSAWRRQSLHHTMSVNCAAAALATVIGEAGRGRRTQTRGLADPLANRFGGTHFTLWKWLRMDSIRCV